MLRTSPDAPARDLAPASTFALFPLVIAAKRVIAPNATYAVAVGESPPTDRFVRLALSSILQWALAPRRYTTDVQSAQWVITYHHSSETLGVQVLREIGLDADGNAVQVAR